MQKNIYIFCKGYTCVPPTSHFASHSNINAGSWDRFTEGRRQEDTKQWNTKSLFPSSATNIQCTMWSPLCTYVVSAMLCHHSRHRKALLSLVLLLLTEQFKSSTFTPLFTCRILDSTPQPAVLTLVFLCGPCVFICIYIFLQEIQNPVCLFACCIIWIRHNINIKLTIWIKNVITWSFYSTRHWVLILSSLN